MSDEERNVHFLFSEVVTVSTVRLRVNKRPQSNVFVIFSKVSSVFL